MPGPYKLLFWGYFVKASLVKGRCRACEAEGFLPVCGYNGQSGTARRNPSGPSGHLFPLWRYAPPPPERGSLSLTREALCYRAPASFLCIVSKCKQ